MELITGVANTPHVTSTQHRSIFESIIGPDSYILNKGELLEPELGANNTIRINSGLLSHHGGIAEVAANTYDEVVVANGTQGMQRIDLIVARYERAADTQIETMSWEVIQGQPAESNPVLPSPTQGNMQDGDLVDDCSVFAVHLDGINITEIEKLLPVMNAGVYEAVEDSGWVALTPDGNYEAIGRNPPRVRRRGKVVELSGSVRNTVNSIGGTSTEVRIGITLPEEYRPSKMVIVNGSTNKNQIFQFRVNTNGTLTVSRAWMNDGTDSFKAMAANTSIVFHTMYLID